MADRWFGIIESDTGKLVSTGTVLADELPPGMEIIELGTEGPPEGKIWDPASRGFVDPPAPPVSPEEQAARGLVAQAKASLKNPQAANEDRMRAATFLRSMGEL